MTEWVQAWQTERISNCKKFTLAAQTASALVRTRLCLALLFEDLLGEQYDFVLTSRFQGDPLERQFGQYCQMSGGRFLVGLWDETSSEKIIKIKSLLKEDLDLDNVKVESTNNDETTSRLLSHTGIVSCSPEHLSLSDESREVTLHTAGYITKKFKKRSGNCCKEYFSGNLVPENSDFSIFQSCREEDLPFHRLI